METAQSCRIYYKNTVLYMIMMLTRKHFHVSNVNAV